MQATAARWLTLSFGASMLLAGCSGDARSPIIDGGGVPGSCEVDNGGCSITPMVACGTSDRGVVCGACPSDYRGDGRVCTSLIRVDECARGSDNCAATAMCVNTPGAYICTCHRGFAGNGVTCAHVGCEAAADCDDDVACTVDSCSASGSCLHAPTSALCGAETSCNPVSGCVAGAACSSPADCADSDPCTLETCNASTGTCEFQVADSDQDGEVPWVCGGTDCNDADDDVGSSRLETCGNRVDDDCDGVVDNDATLLSDPLTLLSSESHCGACGRACAQGETCNQGACLGCPSTPGAPCCGAACVSTDTCSATGAPSLYRIDMLRVPSAAEAEAGAIVGHDLDDAWNACGAPDYAGSVDNSLIDLVGLLAWLNRADPYSFQDEISASLDCVASGPTCARLDLFVLVQTGTGCLRIEIQDAAGNTLDGPFAGTPSAGGDFIGRASSFTLAIPQRTAAGTVMLNFRIYDVTVSGTLSQESLTNLIVGGAMDPTDLGNMLVALIPIIGGGVNYQDHLSTVPDVLSDLFVGSFCSRMSVGLLGSGSLVPD